MTEENKYLDKLFQNKFSGFEAKPPASVWENVHAELHGKGGGGVNPVNLAVLAALVLISGLLGFSIIKDSPSATLNNITIDGQTAMLIEYVPPASPEMQGPAAIIDNKQRHAPETKPVPGSSGTMSKPEKTESAVQAENVPHNSLHDYYVEETFGSAFSEEARLAMLRSRRSYSLHTSMLALNSQNIQVRDSKLNPKYAGINDGERQYNRRASWQLGVFFTPEVVLYPEDSIPNQRSYTFEVTGKWQKNEFFIESGLGLSFSSDDGKYAIDYEKFLGTYDDVYNVTFDTTEGGTIVPVYHTNIVSVYDSIDKYRIEQTKNRYTYLQVPVYIGFHKEVNRFGWFIKGGPILSILVNENIPKPDAGNDRIVNIDQKMPTRINASWQLAFSAGLTYQLSQKVGIAIEPTFKYYLNSQYERKYITTRHPYSFGLRTGLLFNF